MGRGWNWGEDDTYMSLDFDYPLYLSPEQLDALLAKGWFRMRETVFTTHFYMRDGLLLSTVWLRSALSRYKFSKSQRKQLRYLHQRYTITFSSLHLTPEHEELYQRYLSIAKGDRAEKLQKILVDLDCLIFNSQQLEVRDPLHNNRLVAYSIFDIGATSLESITGIYDPTYHDDSLGVYTMMLEVEYAIKQGFLYYYIGYFTPGFTAFDYKLRLDQVEYYDPDQDSWFDIAFFDIKRLWSSVLIHQLQRAQQYLQKRHVQSTILLNVHYDTVVLNSLSETFLEQPVFLDVRFDKNNRLGLMCYFCLEKRKYVLVMADYESREIRSRRPIDECTHPQSIPEHRYLVRKTHFMAEADTPEDLFIGVYGDN